MSARTRTLVWLVVMAMMVPGLASAARKGRLVGIVVDTDGKPVAGVTVTATSDQVKGFHEVRVTDAKGVFKVDFETVEVVYKYQFEKVGYQTMRTEQLWELEGTARHTFVLYPGTVVAVGDASPATASARAAQAFNRGRAALEGRDWAAAAAHFEEALEHDPELRQGWAALGAVRLEQGRPQEAVEAAEKAMALGASDELVLRTRWEACRQLGDEARTAAALADLERAGSLAEEAKRIHNEGVALARAGDDQAAFDRFLEATRVDPNLQAAQLGLATSALKVGRSAEALAAARAMLAAEPGSEAAIRIRYNASLQLGDEDRIVEALSDLAEFEPQVARDGLWTLALKAYDADDGPRAKERMHRVLEVNPDNPHANYLLGLVYLGEEDSQNARRYLQRFVELAPDDPEATSARELVTFLGGS